MVLVTDLNQLIRQGKPLDAASARGLCLRLIPFLVAAGTGSVVQRPLATVVVGGLVTAMVLTLLIVPVLTNSLLSTPPGVYQGNRMGIPDTRFDSLRPRPDRPRKRKAP